LAKGFETKDGQFVHVGAWVPGLRQVSAKRKASTMLVRENIPPSREPRLADLEVSPRRAKILARFVLAALAFFLVAVWSWILGIALHSF